MKRLYFITISLKSVPKGPIGNNPALVQIMAGWYIRPEGIATAKQDIRLHLIVCELLLHIKIICCPDIDLEYKKLGTTWIQCPRFEGRVVFIMGIPLPGKAVIILRHGPGLRVLESDIYNWDRLCLYSAATRLFGNVIVKKNTISNSCFEHFLETL